MPLSLLESIRNPSLFPTWSSFTTSRQLASASSHSVPESSSSLKGIYSTFRPLKSIENITGDPLQNWNQSIDTLSLCVSKIMDFQSATEILAVLLNNWMTLDKKFHLAKSQFAHLYTEKIMLTLQSNHSKNIDVWKAPSSEPGILPALNKELFSFNQSLCLLTLASSSSHFSCCFRR